MHRPDNRQTKEQSTDTVNKKRIYVPNRQKIRDLRERHGYCNWAALSSASTGNLSSSSIRNAERGMLTSCRTLQAIAQILGGEWEDYLDPNAAENQEVLRDKAGRNRSLADCMGAILDWEKQQPPDIPLDVATLAIDLAQGWTLIHTAITATNSTHINFRILVLTPDETKLPGSAPAEVRAWSRAAGGNLDVLRTRFAAYNGPKLLSAQVREYCDLPTIHGLRAGKSPHSMFAISCCQFIKGPPETYDYGERQYRLFAGDTKGTAEMELRDEYSERLDVLWRKGMVLFDLERVRREKERFGR